MTSEERCPKCNSATGAKRPGGCSYCIPDSFTSKERAPTYRLDLIRRLWEAQCDDLPEPIKRTMAEAATELETNTPETGEQRCTCGEVKVWAYTHSIETRTGTHYPNRPRPCDVAPAQRAGDGKETSVTHEGVRQSYLKACEISLASELLGDGDRSDLLELYESLWPRAPSDIRADGLRHGKKSGGSQP